jgi:Subtilase family
MHPQEGTLAYSWGKNMLPSIADEIGKIVGCLGEDEIEVVPAGKGVGYICAKHQILVRQDYLVRVVLALLTPPMRQDFEREMTVKRESAGLETLVDDLLYIFVSEYFEVTPVVPGVVSLPLTKFGIDVGRALDDIDDRLGTGIATPDHVLTVAGEVTSCPATEPEPVWYGTEPVPGVCHDNSGEGVLIYIADTGLLEDADETHAWLRGVERARKPDGSYQSWDEHHPGENNSGVIPPYAGHGTFVAGVARCMAPRADVIVANIFKKAGSRLESDTVRELAAALGLGVDIFHLSMAAATRKDLPLLSFEAWLKLLRTYQGVVCVVAAGNSGSRRPSWPAAFTGMVSVGALGADRHDRAEFSNYGGWVDVYAPGRNLVNAYATGPYEYYVYPYAGRTADFYGMAKWSGTSFSAPIVTGLIAARMSRTGENGQQAADALLAEARSHAIPGVGAVIRP